MDVVFHSWILIGTRPKVVGHLMEDAYVTKEYWHAEDPVNHPAHYKSGSLEVITVIEEFNLNFRMGNAIKYILRANKKDNKIQDIKKAIWYLRREIGESQ